MPLDPSDDDSSDDEREFDWEPPRNYFTEVEGADAVDPTGALDGLLCPIGHGVMRDPVVTDDGHSYERCNIVRWFAKHTTSPLTGKKLRHTCLIPNLALRKTIAEWLERQREEKKTREDDNDARVETARVSWITREDAAEAYDSATVENEEIGWATREDAAEQGMEADNSATVENDGQPESEEIVSATRDYAAERGNEADDSIVENTSQTESEEKMARGCATNKSEECDSVDVEMGQESESCVKAESCVKISVQALESIMMKSEVICTKKSMSLSCSTGNGVSAKHYRRKKCSHPQCQSQSKGKGVCVKHGYQFKQCEIDGCKKRAYAKRVCKSHGGGGGVCSVPDCSLPIFQQQKCHYHYRCAAVCELIVTDDPSFMSFDQNIVETILRFAGGWDDWEWVIKFACVCKSWRSTLTNQLSQIGLQEMKGGCSRKLNADAFLAKLTEQRFQDADTIYVPCDKAVDLYVNEVRQVCPTMKTLVHRKWLKVDRGIEFVQQGAVPLQCQRMYKHDKPNKEGMVWVKWEWDKKIEEVYEWQFLNQYTLGTQRLRMATDFYIRRT